MVAAKALGEAHNEEDVRLDTQSRERLCRADSNGRLEICERVAAILRAQSNSSTVTFDFWKHVRLAVVALTVERVVM